MLLDDTWFYWCHRLLHQRLFYKYVHREHHKSVDVNPFSSFSFHFAEAFLLTSWILVVALTVPIYSPVLFVLQFYGMLDNIKSHLGYEIYPSWFQHWPLRWLTTSTYHNQHHAKFHGNYGVHFRFWDRLMGTEFADYDANFAANQNRNRDQASRTARAVGWNNLQFVVGRLW